MAKRRVECEAQCGHVQYNIAGGGKGRNDLRGSREMRRERRTSQPDIARQAIPNLDA